MFNSSLKKINKFVSAASTAKIKEKLETDKKTLEEELQRFAEKDKKLKDNWDTKFPRFSGDSGNQQLEEEADEVEEYITKLPIEHSLESRLKDINSALEKIKKGKYGKCENCGKKIPKERLEIAPEARLCLLCSAK
jgi:DnaK suppressor protein